MYLSSIVENLPQLVYWKDKNYLYQGCNKFATKVLKLNSSADVINKSDYDFNWSSERIKSLHDIDKLVIEKGISSVVEDVIPINGVSTIFLTSKTALRNENGDIIGILGISTDISEQKKTEEELKKATINAEAANHAKTEFIANMSHDIRTPLTGVVGMSQMLEDGAIDPKQCLQVTTNESAIIEAASVTTSAPTTPPPAADEAPIPASTVATDAPMLLLVEDNTIALMTLEYLVTEAGLQFMSAVDGSAALELAKTHPFDLIITDLGLPGLSGIELAQGLRVFEMDAGKKPVPIIGLTAHADTKIKQECLEAGMNEALTKPMTAEGLNLIKSTWFSAQETANILDTSTNTAPSSTGDLGIDLPDTEAELFELAAFPVLNAKSALKEMNNNKDLFNRMLKAIVDTELSKDLAEMNAAYSHDDWVTVENIAHRMKGGFVYCGISRLAFACQYLERYHKAGHTTQLLPLYEQVIRVATETSTAIKRWLAMQG